jgi:predicted nucleic acid-binding protein
MNATFIDTSFLIALTVDNDELHHRALKWQRFIKTPLLTSEFVLLEFFDAMVATDLRERAELTARAIESSPRVTLISLDRSLMMAGRTMFNGRPDKSWTLTDCISFCIMREHDVSEALTYDHHFEQAGFRALLRADPPSN